MSTRNTEELRLRLMELNQRFLAEVERGAGWKDLKDLIEQMKEVAKKLEHLPATVVSFDTYPAESKTSEAGT